MSDNKRVEVVLRPDDESGDTIRLALNEHGYIELSWFDGRTDFTVDDLRWLVEDAGPAILAAARRRASDG